MSTFRGQVHSASSSTRSCCGTPATRTPPWTSSATTDTTFATTTYDACHHLATTTSTCSAATSSAPPTSPTGSSARYATPPHPRPDRSTALSARFCTVTTHTPTTRTHGPSTNSGGSPCSSTRPPISLGSNSASPALPVFWTRAGCSGAAGAPIQHQHHKLDACLELGDPHGSPAPCTYGGPGPRPRPAALTGCPTSGPRRSTC